MTSAPVILAVLGMSGVGKSEVVDLLRDAVDGERVYFGGVVVDEVARRGLSGPEAEELVRNELRAEHGMAAVAHVSLPRIQALLDAGRAVVIDGVYSAAEERLLRDRFPGRFTTVAVHSAKHLRYQRLGNRPVRPLTQADTDRRDLDEIVNLDKATPIVLADHHLLNDGTLEELKGAVDEVVAAVSAGTRPARSP